MRIYSDDINKSGFGLYAGAAICGPFFSRLQLGEFSMKTLIRFGLGLLFAITVIACSSGGGPEGSGSLNPEENNGKSPVETGALAISISVPQSTVFSDDSISITAKV